MSNRDRYKQELIELLEEHGASKTFVNNLISNNGKYRGISKKTVLEHYLNEPVNPRSWIDQMSNWSSTPQGHGYWAVMDKKLKDRLSDVTEGKKKRNKCRSIW